MRFFVRVTGNVRTHSKLAVTPRGKRDKLGVPAQSTGKRARSLSYDPTENIGLTGLDNLIHSSDAPKISRGGKERQVNRSRSMSHQSNSPVITKNPPIIRVQSEDNIDSDSETEFEDDS